MQRRSQSMDSCLNEPTSMLYLVERNILSFALDKEIKTNQVHYLVNHLGAGLLILFARI